MSQHPNQDRDSGEDRQKDSSTWGRRDGKPSLGVLRKGVGATTGQPERVGRADQHQSCARRVELRRMRKKTEHSWEGPILGLPDMRVKHQGRCGTKKLADHPLALQGKDKGRNSHRKGNWEGYKGTKGREHNHEGKRGDGVETEGGQTRKKTTSK